MARPIRIEFEGAVYHVTARGNERRAIFRSDDDRALFFATLEECVKENGLALHAWRLMPNHYHLIIEIPLGNLSRAIGWLQTTYTVRFNRRHARTGHLFQGRFKAQVVDADAYSMELVRYIHLNPVRPRNKSALNSPEDWMRLEAFAWSSHRDYAGIRKPPGWRSIAWLSFFGKGRRAATREYVRFMKLSFEKPIESPWKQLRGGLVLGGQELWNRVAGMISGKPGSDELHWTRREGRNPAVTARVRRLPDQEEDDRLKIWLRVRLGYERKVDVAREYGYRDGSAVLQILKRLEEKAKKDRDLKAKLSRWRKANASRVQS